MDVVPFHFLGGSNGPWLVTSQKTIVGESLTPVERLEILNPDIEHSTHFALPTWLLRGNTSNARYITQSEQAQLAAVRPELGRPEATSAALIPIRKSPAWWALAQDERRAIFEERSHHTAASLRFLPAIARRLHHSRDLGEPFDFLTWFEFAPEHTAAFDELVGLLRATEEWKYVEREIDIRLTRENAGQ